MYILMTSSIYPDDVIKRVKVSSIHKMSRKNVAARQSTVRSTMFNNVVEPSHRAKYKTVEKGVLFNTMQFMHSFPINSGKNIKNSPFLCKILFINYLRRASDCFSDTRENKNFQGEVPRNPLILPYCPPARAFGTRFREMSTSCKKSST